VPHHWIKTICFSRYRL